MVTLVGISGSTRRGSFNSSLLRVLAASAPQGTAVRIESIAAVPLYNGDEEAERGIPEPVARLKDAIASAQGVLLVTPEYNNSVPGVAKNAIDWCSRPPADVPRVFRGKPVALAGASPGGFGTVLRRTRGCRCSARSAWSSTRASFSCPAPAACSTRTATSRTRR